jgi:hypothetical protein
VEVEVAAGVSYNSVTGRYYARFYKNRKEYYVGSFGSEEEATVAREAAKRDLENGIDIEGSNRSQYQLGEYPGDWETYFYDSIHPNFLDNPEYEIRYYVMIGALRDLRNSKRGPIREDAIEWINGRCESPPTYSFAEICELFNIDPDKARERINSNIDNVRVRIRRSTVIKKAA